MGMVVRFPQRHARASSASAGSGRETSTGQSAPLGQLVENQTKARSRRLTLISAPPSSAVSFFPSFKARELTVVRGTPSSSAYRRATVSRESIPDMHGISVSLPVLSTVNVPNAQLGRPCHPTGMDLKLLLTNIDRHIRVQKTTDNAISKKAGRVDAIRNLRRYAAGDIKGTWTLDVLDDVAKALGTSSWELLRPPGAVPEDGSFRDYIDAVVDEKLAQASLPRKKIKHR